MKIKLPRHVQAFVDRHGKARYYFRKPGCGRAALPGLPWSPEFMAAYDIAIKGIGLPRTDVGSSRTIPGTIDALVADYVGSPEFQALSSSTQATYRGIIERFRVQHGDKRVAKLEHDHIARMVAAKAARPAAAHNLLRMLRLLMKFAVTRRYRKDDPTAGIRSPRMRSGGFYTWSEDDIAKFEKQHGLGTRARLALALLLFTAQRRSDVVRMGRQHVKDNTLTIRQQKTGAIVEIPVMSELRAAIDAMASDHLTYLVTDSGKSFTAAGFGNWFREVCDEAGLPKGCAAHGLRKAASRRLAEAGCTPHEIMAITGHKSLREVTRYTEAAERKRLARTAIAKIVKPTKAV